MTRGNEFFVTLPDDWWISTSNMNEGLYEQTSMHKCIQDKDTQKNAEENYID